MRPEPVDAGVAQLERQERDLAAALARVRAALLEARVLEYLVRHPGATLGAVAGNVRGDRNRVIGALRALEAAGRVRWAPDRMAMRWSVLEERTMTESFCAGGTKAPRRRMRS